MGRSGRSRSTSVGLAWLMVAVALIGVASGAAADGNEAPLAPVGARSITAGVFHTCALLDDATVTCWGFGANGRLGQDSTANLGDAPGEMAALNPVNLGAGRTATAVTAGQAQQHPCTYTTTPTDVPMMTNQVLVTTDQGVFALSGTRRTRVDPPVLRPDARIRLAAGAFAGDGTYNTTGAGQARAANVANLGTATFTIRIQNDGNTTETFTVKGLGPTPRYTVTYKNGPINITLLVVAGTFTTDPLAPGATQDLTLTIRARPGTPIGNTINRLTTITSVTDTSKKDAVKATVTRR